MIDVADGGALYSLGTHIWIWAFQGERGRFGSAGLARIERATLGGRTRISAISVWEVGRLLSRERVTVDAPADDWLAEATTVFAFGTGVTPIDARIAFEGTRLPNLSHKDPADRFLIATARTIGARLVTVDEVILRYGETGHVRVLAPRD